MKPSDALRLIVLSAVWGASFLFMRVAAPAFGPFALILVRVGGAAIALVPVLLKPANRVVLRDRWRDLLVLGAANSALPFTLFGFALLSLEAGFTSLLNATTPIFTALVGLAWLRIPLRRSQVAGLVIGFLGIAILVGDRLSFRVGGSGWSVAAVLAATCSYGFAGHFAKRRLAEVPSLVVSSGSLLFGGLLLAPIAAVTWPAESPAPSAWVAAIALAVGCTALAFVMFFDLLRRTSATAASTITFVIPVFGVLWGVVFLGEAVTPRMVAGMAVALLGTALTTGVIGRRRGPRRRESGPGVS